MKPSGYQTKKIFFSLQIGRKTRKLFHMCEAHEDAWLPVNIFIEGVNICLPSMHTLTICTVFLLTLRLHPLRLTLLTPQYVFWEGNRLEPHLRIKILQ
jgi:hypothetical protein